MLRPYDILIPGELNPDLILSGDVQPVFGQVEKLVDSAELVVGSSSAIFACGAARLGLRLAFAGVAGDDLFGHFMFDRLVERGIDVSAVRLVPSLHTGLSVILSRGSDRFSDRAILTFPGSIAALTTGNVPDDLLAQARHLHVASYFLQTGLQAGLPSLFRRAHSLGLTISLDTNWDPQDAWQGVEELLPLIDIFLPNQAELLSISRQPDLPAALSWIAMRTPLAVVKLGVQGAVLAQGSLRLSSPSIPVQVVDTIGAGDSFDSGFLFGVLSGWDPERCLKLGVACGGLSTQKSGGTAAQPELEEALRRL